ncbi:MAG TPA: baseplate J/gp47 family protein [Candidatus Aphodousia faecavium]|nr:baseplate J/gp47 family protein [Candidatus Aphodousia faecavium]
MAFKIPTLRELIKQMTEDAEREAGTAQLRMSNLRVLPKVFAFAAYGLYSYIRYISYQIFPDTAEDEYLLRQASIQGIYPQEGESMESVKQRLLDRLRNPPRGGTAYDYVFWAKEVEGVTRAWCFPKEQGIGTVVVRFVTDSLTENGIPTAEKVQEVQSHIEQQAPIPASITVLAPEVQVVNFKISDLLPSNDTVKAKIQAELQSLLIREGEPGKILYRSHIEQAISSVSEEENHVLVSPSEDIVCGNTKILVMGEVEYVET